MAEKKPGKLRKIVIDRIDIVDKGANPDARIMLFKRDVSKAEWTAAFISTLPDSSFAVIESGGEKDEDGKTVPRSLRHLPYKDANGKVDLPHLRNALTRLSQTKLSDELKAKARRKLKAAAKEEGVGEAAEKLLKMEHGMTFDEIVGQDQVMDKFNLLHSALMRSMDSIRYSEDDNKEALLKQTIQEFVEALGKIDFAKKENDMKGNISKFFTTLGQKLGLTEAEIREFESVINEPEGGKTMDAKTDTRFEELEKRLKDSEEREKAKEVEIAKAKADADQANQRAIQAEAIAKAEKDARELQAFAKRAGDDFGTLPGTAEEKGGLLKLLHDKLGKEDAEKVEKLLRSGQEFATQAKALEAVGKDGTPTAGNAWGKIEQMAKSLVSEGKAKTIQEAVTQVATANPDLYRDYKREQQ